jgi:hypothetical protein
MTRLATVLLMAAALSADAALGAPPQAASARGSQILNLYKQQLQAALKGGMQRGPLEAISACRVEAPQVAAAVSVDGVVVGRASHRLRNPENVAPDWVAPILADYVENSTGRLPRTVALDGGREGYVEPIFLQPLCTACHGEDIAPALRDEITALYPEDRATGFEPGDLRGVFWVEYPLDETPARRSPESTGN